MTGSIRADVLRIHLFGRNTSSAWLSTLKTGYEQIGDGRSFRFLLDHLLQSEPSSRLAWEVTWGRWQEAHPPSESDNPAGLMNAVSDWGFRWPHLPHIIVARWNALARDPKASPADLGDAANALVQLSNVYPDLHVDLGAAFASVPFIYSKHSADALRQAEDEERYEFESEKLEVRTAAKRRIERLRRASPPVQ